MIVNATDVVIAPKRVSSDLGNCAKARIGGSTRLMGQFRWIHLANEDGDRPFGRALRYRSLCCRDELVLGPVEMGHDEGGVRSTRR